MQNVQKMMLSLTMISSLSYCVTAQEARKALAPENIERFQNVECFTLENEEDIKTCAQVKLLMAQALEASYTPGTVQTISSIIAGGFVGALLGLVTPRYADNYQNYDLEKLVKSYIGAVLGGSATHLMQRYVGSSDQRSAAKFCTYFENLIQDPCVIDRETALANRERMNRNAALEAAFNKLNAKHAFLEKSPVFAQYRATRSARDAQSRASQDEGIGGFPGDEDQD